MEDIKSTKPIIYIKVSPSVVCGLLRISHTLSGGSQGQNYFHNNTNAICLLFWQDAF